LTVDGLIEGLDNASFLNCVVNSHKKSTRTIPEQLIVHLDDPHLQKKLIGETSTNGSFDFRRVILGDGEFPMPGSLFA
jgi:hypothetical protein